MSIEGTKPEVGKSYRSIVDRRRGSSKPEQFEEYMLPAEEHLHRILRVDAVNLTDPLGRQVVGVVSMVPVLRPDAEPVTRDFATSLEIFAETWTPLDAHPIEPESSADRSLADLEEAR